MDRMSTGIHSLDVLLAGGFPIPSVILIIGSPGTGKTILATQIVFNCASNGINALYILGVSEPSESLKKYTSQFKYYNTELINEKKVIFFDMGETLKKQPFYILSIFKRAIETYMPKIIVIDPITIIEIAIKDDRIYREFLHDFINYTKSQNLAVLLIGEMNEKNIDTSMLSYMSDGIIVLSYSQECYKKSKYIEILKMRGTKHLLDKYKLNISENGFEVMVK